MHGINNHGQRWNQKICMISTRTSNQVFIYCDMLRFMIPKFSFGSILTHIETTIILPRYRHSFRIHIKCKWYLGKRKTLIHPISYRYQKMWDPHWVYTQMVIKKDYTRAAPVETRKWAPTYQCYGKAPFSSCPPTKVLHWWVHALYVDTRVIFLTFHALCHVATKELNLTPQEIRHGWTTQGHN